MSVSLEPGSFIYDEVDVAAPMDGLLGMEFLSNYKTAVNFKKKLIYFW